MVIPSSVDSDTWSSPEQSLIQDLMPDALYQNFNANNSASLSELIIFSRSDSESNSETDSEQSFSTDTPQSLPLPIQDVDDADADLSEETISVPESTPSDNAPPESDSDSINTDSAVQPFDEVLVDADLSEETISVPESTPSDNAPPESDSDSMPVPQQQSLESVPDDVSESVQPIGFTGGFRHILARVSTSFQFLNSDIQTETSRSESDANQVEDIEPSDAQQEQESSSTEELSLVPAFLVEDVQTSPSDEIVNDEASDDATLEQNSDSEIESVESMVPGLDEEMAQDQESELEMGTTSEGLVESGRTEIESSDEVAPSEVFIDTCDLLTQCESYNLSFNNFSLPDFDTGEHIESVQIRLSLSAKLKNILPDDIQRFSISYRYDDSHDWQVATNINIEGEISNALNGGYFLVTILRPQTVADLASLSVNVAYQGDIKNLERAHIDSLWLEVLAGSFYEMDDDLNLTDAIEYDRSLELPKFHDLHNYDSDFTVNTLPSFTMEYSPQEGFFRRVINTLFSDTTYLVSSFRMTDSTGTSLHVPYQVIYHNEHTWTIQLTKLPQKLRPGTYTVSIDVEENGTVYTDSFQFYWGVLAVNTRKSMYTPNETVDLELAALTDRGDTICNADLRLKIIDPTNSVSEVPVNQSGSCGKNNVTDIADYIAIYAETAEIGVYTVQVEHYNVHGALVHKIQDSFEVREFIPYDITRSAPTRIYPPAPYRVTLDIVANRSFTGDIVERVPRGFVFIDAGSASITTLDEAILLTWHDVTLAEGERLSLSYEFDAPDISPYMFLLGPLDMDGFQELRQWQIASDALGAVARLTGTQTVSGTNLNSLASPFVWSTSTLDNYYFSHSTSTNSERLVIRQPGDYMVALTMPLERTDTNGRRTRIGAEVRVNGVVVPQGVGRSAMMILANAQNESSNNLHFLLTNLQPDDYVEIITEALTTINVADQVVVSGEASLYVEHIPPGAGVFAATATTTTNSENNVNATSSYPLIWTETRQDSGFIHSDTINPEDIIISNPGAYLVYINLPLESQVPNVSPKGRVLLDGVEVPAGQFMQGFLRGPALAEVDTRSSIHWSGVVIATTTNQVLTITTEMEAASGSTTVPVGFAGSVYIQQLPTEDIIHLRGNRLVSGTNFNVTPKSPIQWNTQPIIDSVVYSHSTSTDNHEITINEGGDYVLVFNDALTAAGGWNNVRITVEVDDVEVTGAQTKSNMISNAASGLHREASSALVYQLVGITAGQVVTVSAIREGNTTNTTAITDASLLLWKKAELNLRAEVDASLGTPFDNIRFASTTPLFAFTANDPDGTSDLEYEFSISTTSSFTSSTTRNSSVNSGFSNIDTPADTSPFIENERIEFQLSLGDALQNNTTYFWRVRARDVSGSGEFGDWSTTQSLTIDLTANTPNWYQTKGQQFSTNDLINIIADDEDSLVVDADPPSDVMMVYGEGTVQTPRYRHWNGTTWGSEQSAESVGATINFIKSEAAPNRDEYAMVTLNASNQAHAQIYSESAGTWDDLMLLSTVSLATARGVAVAYESVSGDAVAVACDGTNAVYSIWDGTSWSATSSISLAKATDCYQLELASNPASDEIILVSLHQRTGSPDFEALVWDGSSWSNSVTFGDTNTDTYNTIQVSYNRLGTQGLVVVDNGNAFRYSIWDGVAWTTPTNEPVGARKYAGKLVPSPYSNDIALCFVDSLRRIQTMFWTGSSWNGATILSTDANEASGKPVDCVYETSPGRAGNLLVTYADRTQPRYRYFNGTTWSSEQTMVSLNRIPVIQTISATDGVVVSNLVRRDLPRTLYGTQFNGSAWSTEEPLETAISHNATVPREVFWLSPKRNQFNEGFATTFPINFSDVPGRPSWGDVVFATTEPLGTDVKVRLKYNDAGTCDAYVANGDLPGNDDGFDVTAQPIDISGVSTTTYDALCLEARLTTSGNSSAALDEWQLTWERQPRLIQNNYRWYVDGSFLTPTDPWPVGTEDVDENEPLDAERAIDIGQSIRLRMSLQGSNVDLPQFQEVFKLQYAAGNICSPNLVWTDVGEVGSTTAVWRGATSAVVGDDWFDENWQRRIKITVDNSLVNESVIDFPVYVNLANLPVGFFNAVKSDGGDVRITTDDGVTQLPFDLTSINTGANTGELHFKADLSSTTDSEFYIYYGNSSAVAYAPSATFGSQNVWTNGYNIRYSLNENPDNSAPQFIDRSGNNNNASKKTGAGQLTGSNLVAGKIGNGINHTAANHGAAFTQLNYTGTFTASLWWNASGDGFAIAGPGGANEKIGPWSTPAGQIFTRVGTTSDATVIHPADGTWTHVVITRDSSNKVDMYINSSPTRLFGDAAQTLPSRWLNFGGENSQSFRGILDEIRFANVQRSAGWITTEFNNQNNPIAFYSVSAEEQIGNGQDLPSVLLSTSDNPETYVEENPTRENQNPLLVDEESEWDFVLENNAGSSNTNYCFRMVYENGTVLSEYERYPRLITNAPPLAPVLIAPFDNERLASTTPWFEFAADDELGNDVSYEIEVSSDISFSLPEITRESNANFAQFTNLAQTAQKGIYTAGQTIRFIPNTPLSDGTTYFWRVRARDDNGSGDYGPWSRVHSLTITTGITVSTWYQHLAEQFDTNELDGAVTNYSGDDIRIETGGTTATTTSTEIDFNKGTIGNAWGNFSFTNSGAGTIRYYVEYQISSSEFALVPDSDLSGNSAGFTSSPVDISALDTKIYRVLRVVAVHSGTDANPRHQSWEVEWAETIEIPTLVSLFDNAKIANLTPTLSFFSTDPDNDDIEYEIQIDTTIEFSSPDTYNSDTDPGFQNLDSPSNPNPFNSGERVGYTIQSALSDGTTYFWRVRARDPFGVGAWSEYSIPRSFTVDSTQVVPAWHQTTGEQFLTNETNDIEGTLTSAQITSTISGVLTVFGQGSEISPRYQLWNGSSWGSLGSAEIIGAPARWIRTKAAPLRPEYALGVQATNQEITLQIYNSEIDSWGNLYTIATSIPSGQVRRRAFDIAYESDSSRLLAVACDGTNAVYSIWNGSSWTATSSISLSKAANCEWVTLSSNPVSNEVIALFQHSNGGTPDYEALVWNGSGWGSSITFGDTASNNLEAMAASYNSAGNQAVLVFSNGSATSFRYSIWNGSSWSTNLTENLTRRFYWGSLAVDPYSNQLALCYITDTSGGSTYAGVKVWDGAAWGNESIMSTSANSPSGRSIDCTYETTPGREGNLLVTYSDIDNARYQFSTSSPDVFSGEQTLDVIEDSWAVINVRGADGTIHTVFFDDVNDNYDYSRWNGADWTSREQFSTNPSFAGTPFDGSLDMAAQIFPSFTSGSIRSNTIDFADGGSPRWQEINWDDETPGASSIEYQVFYESSPGVFSLVPDVVIPGNSSGLTSSPIDISDLDPLIYDKLQLEASLICDSGECPVLNEWTVEWSEGITISGVAFEYDQSTSLATGTIAVAVNGVLQVGRTGEISSSVGTQKAIFDTAGTSTFTVPIDVTELTVKAWGAGGGGGGGAISRAGGTGGAGGFVQGTIATTPAEDLLVHVGGGGGAGLFGVPAGGGGGGGYSGLYRTSTPLAIAGGGGGGGAGGGGIGYVGVGEACAVNTGTCAPKLPVNIEPDDVLIAVVHSRTGTLDHTCTTVGCGGWTEFSSQDTGNGRLSVWWKRMASDMQLMPPVFTGSTDAFTARIWAFRGVAKSGNPFDQVTSNTAQASNVLYTGSNIVSTVPNTIMVFVGGSMDDNTWGPAGGSCIFPNSIDGDFYTANTLSNNNSIFMCIGSPQTAVGSLGVPTMTQATNGPDAGRHFAFNLRPETSTYLPPAGVGGVGGGLLGGDGEASDTATDFVATGGSTTDLNGYRFHTFTSAGTFETFNSSRYIEVLLLGGGGGGGGYRYGGGGGGAGGFRYLTDILSPNTYSITIGAGGSGGDDTDTANGDGQDGGNTSFDSYVVLGGGGGQRGDRPNDSSTGADGGSGGGGGSTNVNTVAHAGGVGTTTQGNSGGVGGASNATNNMSGGGGGGAWQTGADGTTSVGGNGGDGLDMSGWFGTGVGDGGWFGGGGGGGKRNTGTAGIGGIGGGADGGVGNNNGVTATANTGGGGGGGGGTTATQFGGGGGGGIVIARYRLPILGGLGGTQSAGGVASGGASNGSAFVGGTGDSGTGGGAGGAGGALTGGDGGTGNSMTAEAGGGGAGAGYFGGGGGARGIEAVYSGAGGGGGSSYIDSGATGTSTENGAGITAGNSGDSDYAGSAGMGGTGGALSADGMSGQAGRVVLSWTGSTTPGIWTIPNVSVTEGDVVTVFIVGVDGEMEAVAVTKYSGTGDISGIQLSERHLTLGSDDHPTITNADLGLYTNTDNEDIFFNVTSGNILDLCVESTCSDARLRVLASTTYQPGANGTVVNFQNNGTFTPSGNTLRVGGAWQQFGIFNTGASTIIFTATTSAFTLQNATTSYSFHNVSFGETTGTALWTIDKPMVVGGNLVINHGTLARDNQPITISGNLSLGLNGFATGLATTTFVGSGTNTWGDAKPVASSTNMGHVLIDGNAKTITLSGNVGAESVMIGADDTLNASGSGFNINVFTNWTNLNSFIPQNGTVTFVGTSTTGTIARGNSPFNNLSFTGSDGNWQFSTPTLALNGSMTIATGTVTLPTGTTTIGASFLNTGGTFLHNNGEVRMTSTVGGRTITQNATEFFNQFYDLVFSGNGSWSFTEAHATTSRHFRIQAGTVTLPSETLTVGADYLVTGSGNFVHNDGEVILLVQGSHSVAPRTSSFNDLRIVGGTSGSWYSDEWEFRLPITISAAQVDDDLSNFPVYVDMDDLSVHFFSNVKSDGGDIRVTQSDGVTEVPVEVVSINTGGTEGEMYFRANTLSSTSDATFYLYYGNPAATTHAVTDTNGARNVWSNGYRLVEHLGDLTTSTVLNSAQASLDGTKRTANNPLLTSSGRIYDAQEFSNSNQDYINHGNVMDSATTFTVSTWFNADTLTGGAGDTATYGYSLFGISPSAAPYTWLTAHSGEFRFCAFSSSAACPQTSGAGLVAGQWYYVSVTAQSGGTATIRLNGNQIYSASAGAAGIGNNFTIGALRPTRSPVNIAFDGKIDAMRVSNVVRSNAWSDAEYRNMATTTDFYVAGGVESIGVRTFTNTDTTILGNFTLDAGGDAVLPTGVLSIGGSLQNTATFDAQAGTVRFNSTGGSDTIEPGASLFSTLEINTTGGDLSLIDHATATVAVNLVNATDFTVDSGITLTTLGTFTNAISDANTTWTGSVLIFAGNNNVITSNKTYLGDTYDTIRTLGTTTVRLWNSSASSYDTRDMSSVYSQDHAGNNGQLYIYGNYTRSSGTEHWSYATDFDGASLVGSERPVEVYIASSSVLRLETATLSVIGSSSASTTITSIENEFSVITDTATVHSNFAVWSNLLQGLTLTASTTIGTLTNTEFVVQPNRTGITIDASTVDSNSAKQFFFVGFSTTTPGSATNATLTGSPSSFVWFREGFGNLYGEDYDSGDGNPGSIRFDDSNFQIDISGIVYADDGTTPMGAPTCDDVTPRVRVVVNGGAYTDDVPCASATGAYLLEDVSYNGDARIVVYLNSDGGERGSTITKTPTVDITDMDLYANRVVVRHEDVTPLSIADMVAFQNVNDDDLSFIATTSPSTELILLPNTELFVFDNKSFIPGGNITLRGDGNSNGYEGTLALGESASFIATDAETHTLAGRLVLATSSIFTTASSTFVFNATTTGKSISAIDPVSFHSLIFDGVGGGWHLDADVVLYGDMILTEGVVTGTSDLSILYGSVSGNGILSLGTGTLTLGRTNSFGGLSPWTVYDVVFGNGLTIGTTTVIASATTTVLNSMSVSMGHTINLSSSLWDLNGSGTVLSINGVFNEDTSVVRYSGAGAQVSGLTYYDLLLDSSSGSQSYVAVGSGIQVFGDLVIGSTEPSVLDLDTNNVQLSVYGDVLIQSNGTLEASDSSDIEIRGDWTNLGAFNGNGGTVYFITDGLSEIVAGNSSFSNVIIDASGSIVVTESATSTGDWLLLDHTNFTVEPGAVLAIGGDFVNTLGDSATTWTGSTLTLFGSGVRVINASTTKDTYATLSVTNGAHLKLWNSSAVTFSTDAGSSIYSQNHEDVVGDLYVFGNYDGSGQNDHWSYTTDFDGTSLSQMSERPVSVYIANNGSVSWNSGSLSVIGSSTASTTIQNQGSGTYAFGIGGTTQTTWNHVIVRNTNEHGISFVGTPTVTDFSFTDHLVVANDSVALTVNSTVINANPAKNFNGNIFATSTDLTGVFNARATGTAISSWRFNNHTGNLSGEVYDDDDGGNPGYMVWDDSAAIITISGRVYQDEGSTMSTICDLGVDNIVLQRNTLNTFVTACDPSDNGSFSFAGVPYTTGDTMVVYISGESEQAAHVIYGPVTSVTNAHLFEQRVILRHETTNPITNLALNVFDGDDDPDVPYTVTAGNLVLPADTKLLIWEGKTFAPGGNVTIIGGGSGASYDGTLGVQANARFEASGTEIHSIGGYIDLASGALIEAASSTFILTTDETGRTVNTNNSILHNLTMNGDGSVTIIDSESRFTGSYLQSGGSVTFDASTTTIHESFDVTGGSVIIQSDVMRFTSTETGNTLQFNGALLPELVFAGTGSWNMLDAHATTTGGVLIEGGTLTLPADTFVIGGSLTNNAGLLAHNDGELIFTATTSATVTASSSDLNAIRFVGGGSYSISDENVTFLDSFVIASGTVVMASGTTAIGGSFVVTDGSFEHASGTVLMVSSGESHTISPNQSPFYNLQIGSLGSYTMSSATTTNNFALQSATSFTLDQYESLTVGGVFLNSLGGASTTWTNTTLNLVGPYGYSINTASQPGDSYSALTIAQGVDIRSWYSDAATTTLAEESSWYSQDHAITNGLLHIYGDFSISSTTEYWSYATDFDGTPLTGGNERSVTVRLAQNATTTVTGGTLQIVGTNGNETTITNQTTGTYSFLVLGGTFNAQYYEFNNLNVHGLQFSGTPNIVDLSRGYFELAVTSGSLLSVSSTTLNANASKIFDSVGFNATSPISGFNVQLIGETVNAWRFTNSYGSIGGEAFDTDGPDQCGSIRFDDSQCLIADQVAYRWRNDDGGEAAPNNEWLDTGFDHRKRVRVINQANQAYTDTVVKFDVAYEAGMQSQFGDLRFTIGNGTTEIPYWIERFVSSNNAEVWVQVPTLPASSQAILYMYYGSSTAVTSSNGPATFEVFEDFESGSLTDFTGEVSKFVATTTRVYGGDYAVAAASAGGRTDATGSYRLDSSATTSQGQIIRFKQYVDTTAGTGDEPCVLFGVQSPGSSNQNYAVCLEQFGTDRISLSRNVFNNDTSGTVLASKNVTYVSGWYEVVIDWQTNNTIDVSLFNSSGALVATTSAIDSSYDSGGFGFAYWFHHGAWDSFVAYPRVARTPIVRVGAEQGRNGASWRSAINAPGGGLPEESIRLRFAIENFGLEITNQEFVLEYAPKGVAPSCEAVNTAAYSPVPSQTACGASPVCMATSTNFTNGEPTTDALFGTQGLFTSGAMVKDPSNKSDPLTIALNYFTEVEYSLVATMNADQTYCLRVIDDTEGPLDFYTRVAELSLQFDPQLLDVNLNQGNTIILSMGTSTTVYATGTVTDFNGFSDLIGGHATATIYRSGVGPLCTPDDNNCYVSSIDNGLCEFTNCSGNSCTLECIANMAYHTEPTSLGSIYEGETWEAYIEVSDTAGGYDFASAPNVDVQAMSAFTVLESIEYGALEPDQDTGILSATTTIVNLGNVGFDLDIDSTDLSSSYSTTIPASMQRFSTSTIPYQDCTAFTCFTASSTDSVSVPLDIPKPVVSLPYVQDRLYWGIFVPFGTAATTHQGVNTFYPVPSF